MKNVLKIKESWRLSPNIIAIITKNNDIYMISSEKKSYKTSIIKKIKDEFFEKDISEIKFSIKFNKDLDLEVKSSELGENWYKVKNFDKSEIGELLTSAENRNGIFQSSDFSIAVSDYNIEEVRLYCPSMSSYKSCVDEMTRRVNCEFYKKTRKWIPGHRYDSLEGTIYYLGEAKSFIKEDKCCAKTPSAMSIKFLYVTEIMESEKTISDVFRNRVYGDGPNDIKSLDKQDSMCDSGEVLVNDSPNLKDFREIMINKILDSKEGDYKLYRTLSYFTPSDVDCTISDDLRNKISNYIYSLSYDVAFHCKYAALNNDSISKDDLLDYMFLDSITFDFVCSQEIIPLILKYGFDLASIAEKSIEAVDKDYYEIFNNNNLDKFIELYPHFGGERSESVITALSDLKETAGDITFDVYKNYINDIIKSSGENSASFKIIDIGTSKVPKKAYLIITNHLSLIKYAKNTLEMPESLKHELLDRYKDTRLRFILTENERNTFIS